MTIYSKEPGGSIDFRLDWGDEYLETGETIETGDDNSQWTVDPTGELTIDSDTHDGTTATVWVSGGVAGKDYHLVNTVVTTDGRTVPRTIVVRVHQR